MNPFTRLSIFLIRTYQWVFSPDTGIVGRIFPKRVATCAFHPTCSEYAVQAIEKYGAFRGWYMAGRRVLRCHPWQRPTIDEP